MPYPEYLVAPMRQELIDLRKKGLGNREIAQKLGLTERVIHTLFYRAKSDGMEVPPSPYWTRGKNR